MIKAKSGLGWKSLNTYEQRSAVLIMLITGIETSLDDAVASHALQ